MQQIAEMGPSQRICRKKKQNCGLTAYIQPGVARGHASHVDGRQSVPTSIRLHQLLYQQALAAGAILIQTVEQKREIQIITALNHKYPLMPVCRHDLFKFNFPSISGQSCDICFGSLMENMTTGCNDNHLKLKIHINELVLDQNTSNMDVKTFQQRRSIESENVLIARSDLDL